MIQAKRSYFIASWAGNILLTLGAIMYCAPPPLPSDHVTTENRTTENITTENRTTENRTTENRTTENRTTDNRTPETKKSYNFEAPDAVLKLQKELKEISGLTLLDNEHLAAIQDEKGKIYTIRITDGKIIEEKRFAQNGDFEGLELVGNTLYALRSDGDIYQISDWTDSKSKTKKHETFLSTKNDSEGLGYDASNHRLLVVCKEEPGAGLKNSRAVYAFDLKALKLMEQPVLIINLKEIENLTPDHPLNKAIRKFASPLKDLSGFKPAALAIHPLTHQIFVISSVRKILLAYNPDGTLEDLWLLSEDSFRQPEGLAFLPNGDLFIANEGGNGRATLMRFNYQ